MSMPSTTSIRAGHVGLILLRRENSLFYLEIPLNIIESLCLAPRKYLLFLGWCILGVEGRLVRNEHELEHDGPLVNRGIYSYSTGNSPLKVVDPEVIGMRSSVPSESTAPRQNFRNKLLERDVCCVWTGAPSDFGSGLHIIPYRRGSEWFQLIVQNRQDNGEDVADLDDINDIRNGMFANELIHIAFDARKLVVLKTPNRFLDIDDIHHHNRPDMPENVKYPTNSRYTLQWLVTPLVWERGAPAFPNNVDAAFKKRTRKPKPSELLLHYNYGAAAVKWWGRNTELLQNIVAKSTRPREHVGAAAGPSRAIHDVVIQKRDAYRTSGAGAGSGGAVDPMESGDQETWDEDDVMLCIMASLPATQERHRKQVEEKTRQLEQWREGVAHGTQ